MAAGTADKIKKAFSYTLYCVEKAVFDEKSKKKMPRGGSAA